MTTTTTTTVTLGQQYQVCNSGEKPTVMLYTFFTLLIAIHGHHTKTKQNISST